MWGYALPLWIGKGDIIDLCIFQRSDGSNSWLHCQAPRLDSWLISDINWDLSQLSKVPHLVTFLRLPLSRRNGAGTKPWWMHWERFRVCYKIKHEAPGHDEEPGSQWGRQGFLWDWFAARKQEVQHGRPIFHLLFWHTVSFRCSLEDHHDPIEVQTTHYHTSKINIFLYVVPLSEQVSSRHFSVTGRWRWIARNDRRSCTERPHTLGNETTGHYRHIPYRLLSRE